MGDLVGQEVMRLRREAEDKLRQDQTSIFTQCGLSKNAAMMLYDFYKGREGYGPGVTRFNYIGTGEEIISFTLRRTDVATVECAYDKAKGAFIHLR